MEEYLADQHANETVLHSILTNPLQVTVIVVLLLLVLGFALAALYYEEGDR